MSSRILDRRPAGPGGGQFVSTVMPFTPVLLNDLTVVAEGVATNVATSMILAWVHGRKKKKKTPKRDKEIVIKIEDTKSAIRRHKARAAGRSDTTSTDD